MAGTVTIVHSTLGSIRKVVMTCTADAADASYPDTALPAFEGRLLYLETNPGATGPSANYDITIINQNGLDVLQGVGANRHTSSSERANIVYAAGVDHPHVDTSDVLTLNIDGNIINDAVTVIELAYAVGA